MIISNKQIMQLITFANDFRAIIAILNNPEFKSRHDEIVSLLTTIANQQPEELKEIK